ncbi:cupin domain-containing protein [Mycolicibacterium sp. CBMA 226]|uniref:cupin domain-containing protein n=1 Tax=Mycolicibacterium sp. CBMA 226 TaxID=2606611 RepID=UPI0012DE5384|nr:AraC family transcriptional regulator [Mycolicibacterium sp. CBMA 226]
MTDPRSQAVPLDASADALSDVLDLIRLHGEELAVVRTVDGRDVVHRAGERVLHIVEDGPVEIALHDGGRVRLEAGDMALLATGTAHRIRAASGGAWMSGRFRVEENCGAPLLAVLPSIIVIPSSKAEFDWLPLLRGHHRLQAVRRSEPLHLRRARLGSRRRLRPRLGALTGAGRAQLTGTTTNSCGWLFIDTQPSSVTTTMSSIRAPHRPAK